MSTETTRLKLVKPDGSEPFTRTNYTGNLDKIDEYDQWMADNYSHDIVLTRTDGMLTKVEEKLDTEVGTLRVETTLTRTDGVLTSVREKVFQNDGVTLVKDVISTLVRENGVLMKVQVRPQ